MYNGQSGWRINDLLEVKVMFKIHLNPILFVLQWSLKTFIGFLEHLSEPPIIHFLFTSKLLPKIFDQVFQAFQILLFHVRKKKREK